MHKQVSVTRITEINKMFQLYSPPPIFVQMELVHIWAGLGLGWF